MLSSELEYCLNEAFQKAREAQHEFITVEHLLLALLDTPQVIEILNSCGADIAQLRRDLMEFVTESTPRPMRIAISVHVHIRRSVSSTSPGRNLAQRVRSIPNSLCPLPA